MKICSIMACERPATTRGWCDMHYQRWQTHGDPLKVISRAEQNRPPHAPMLHTSETRAKISAAWTPERRQQLADQRRGRPLSAETRQKISAAKRGNPTPCSIQGCQTPSAARGWCQTHYQRWRKHGDPLVVIAAADQKRPVWTAERRQQHGDRRRGIPRPDLRGRTLSAETRHKMSLAQLGKPGIGLNVRGEKNGRWKGDQATNHTLRWRHAYVLWRDAVYERDGRACRRCGATTKLHAHHFKSFDDFPDLRHDVDNGITLCASCHKKVHARKDPAFVHIPGESCLKTSDRL